MTLSMDSEMLSHKFSGFSGIQKHPNRSRSKARVIVQQL